MGTPAGSKPDRAIKSYPFKPGLPHDIEVAPLRARLPTVKTMVTEPHRADFHQVVWVRSGKAKLLLDFEEHQLQPDSLLFIRKHRVVMYDKSGSYDGRALLFTDGFFARNQQDARYLQDSALFRISPADPVIRLGRDAEAARAVFNLLEQELARPDDAFQSSVLRNLAHTFLMLCERHAAAPPAHTRADDDANAACQRFLALIEADHGSEKKVAAYARRMGITEKRLQAATSRALGKSPKELIHERIAMEAKRMLLFSRASVKEIAFGLGFDEVTNFVKYFRKHAGTTPASFRARYQA